MDSGGDIGVHQYLGGVFWRLSTVMHSTERERSPQEFILTGFPDCDTLAGTGASLIYPANPDSGRFGSVLIFLLFEGGIFYACYRKKL